MALVACMRVAISWQCGQERERMFMLYNTQGAPANTQEHTAAYAPSLHMFGAVVCTFHACVLLDLLVVVFLC